MEGPPLGPGGEDITWPDQVAPRGRKASSTRKIKPQTSNPDDLSWDEWRLSNSEVERIDLENAASPEEADELEEMTADEMAVDGYYVVAGIARHE